MKRKCVGGSAALKRPTARLLRRALRVGISSAFLSTLLLAAVAHTVWAAGVVGTGTAASCTDAALNAALSGGGLVTFNCGPGAVTIDISTGTGTKSITADTTIDGGGGTITISGGNSVGVFSVNTGVTATVQELTVANGYNSGSAGGIDNNGTLTVTSSTFSGNSAGFSGGGIYNENSGMLTVANSTFSGNSAGYGGGGIYNTNGGTLTITSCTLSGNGAVFGGSGIFNEDGGILAVNNTIVANSTEARDCGGPLTNFGYNIDDDGSCGLSDTSLSNTNPRLDPAGLANNGGPTQTIALQASSPGINAGSEPLCSATPVNSLDQRGYVRPGAGATSCSIGAYEYNAQAPAPPPCVGDCDGSGDVTVDELLTLVNIDLGNANASACPDGIPSGSSVGITQIIQAVNNALTNCPAS